MASRYLCSFLPASYNHFQYQRFFFQFLQMQHGPKLYSSDCCLGSIKCLPHSFHLFGLFHVLAVRHKAFVNTCIQVFMSTRASFSLGFTPRNKTAASIPLILQGSQHVTSQSSCLQSFCQARSGISVGSLCPSLLRNGGLLPAAFQPPLLIKKKKIYSNLLLTCDILWPGVLLHRCNPSTGEGETGGSLLVQGQPRPQYEALSRKTKPRGQQEDSPGEGTCHHLAT